MYYKFKIIRGYSAEDYIEINQDELEKAFYCFLTKKDSVYSGGAVKGSEILAIQPDYHRTMGWNRGYKLQAEDYSELKEKGIDRKMQLELENTGDKIKYLIETRQENLIGKNVEIPKLEKGRVPEDIKKLTGEIADKFKIMKNFEELYGFSKDVMIKFIGDLETTLCVKEKKVLEMRHGLVDGITHTLEEVGKEFGVTRERIRQIEAKAHEKIRINIKEKKQENEN